MLPIRLSLVIVPAVLLVGFIAYVTIFYVAIVYARPLAMVPQEPLVFDHSVHVQVAGLQCEFCHRTADETYTAGLPDVQQCMFCHSVVASTQQAPAQYATDLSKLRTAWQRQEPINWVRNHRMPDHVHFVHASHIEAGVPCTTCHGDVANSKGSLTQVRSLNMGDCVGCHRDNRAQTECVACHY
jgi:hypothetical protein